MNVTQPTMSRSIQELELHAGSRLFDRSQHGVQPTDAGLRFLMHARELVSRSEDLEREMNLLKGLEKGGLRIAAGTFPSHMYVDRAISRFIREHPAVRISLVTENWGILLQRLRKREFDLAVLDGTAAESDPELHVTKLQNHSGYFVMRAGHPVLKNKGGIAIDQTLKYPLVTTSRFPMDMFKHLAEIMMEAKMPGMRRARVLTTVTCESLPMMKSIAMNSDAITILPLNVFYDEVLSGTLVAIPAPDWVRANFGIVHLGHRSLSPVGEEFVEMVQQADAELSAWEKDAVMQLVKRKLLPAEPRR